MTVQEEILAPGIDEPAPRLAPTQEAKTARWLLALIPTTLLVLVVGTRLIVTSDAVSRKAAAYIAQEMAKRTRSTVQLSGVTFAYDFAPCFNDFEIFRFSGAFKLKATTKRACVERWASAIGSGFHAIRLRLAEPSIEIEGAKSSTSAKSSLGAAVKSPELTSAIAISEGGKGGKNALREIQVVFDDLRLDWASMPFPERIKEGSFGPIDGTVTLQIRGGKSAATLQMREPITGSSINGRIDPTPEGWDISTGVEGDVISIFGSLLTADELETFRKLPMKGQIGAVYNSKRHTGTIDIDVEEHDLDVKNRLVASKALTGFSARQNGRLEIDFDRSLTELKDGLIELNGIPVTLSFDLRPGPGSPAFDFRADLKTTPLIRMLRSVPGAREPEFAKALSSNVLFAFTFETSGVLRDATSWQPKLDYRLTGVGPNGKNSGLEYLRGSFQYYPLTPDGRAAEGRTMGPDMPSWVTFARIPYIQKRAVLVSEDSTFYFHHGFDLNEIQDAAAKGLTTGEKARGGSTLTQQLVKNLFLSRDRTALRKAQELLLTFHLEASLTKDQIVELYMNIIEWGPNIYGLKDAAYHYFGKPPEALNPREMCFLAVIIPSPVTSHQQWEQGAVNAKTNGKIDFLLERLNRLGSIPNAQFEQAKNYKIHFARHKEK